MRWAWAIILFSLMMGISFAASNFIPETGCWTYPDKLVCMEPNPVNATVFIKNVSCYAIDQYGTGQWTEPPCIASADMKPTSVRVCYKMLPMKDGKPDIMHYTKEYNCQVETWSGDSLLYIPTNLMPWKCKLEPIDNYTKKCTIEVNGYYYISGAGNNINGTKAIVVTAIEGKTNYTTYIIASLIAIFVVYIAYKKYKE